MGPSHGILVLIAYTQNIPLKPYIHVSCRTRDLMFGLSHSNTKCSSVCFGVRASKALGSLSICANSSEPSFKYQNPMCWLFYSIKCAIIAGKTCFQARCFFCFLWHFYCENISVICICVIIYMWLVPVVRPPRGSVLLRSLKIMHWSPQIPEKILSSLKVICLCSQIPK